MKTTTTTKQFLLIYVTQLHILNVKSIWEAFEVSSSCKYHYTFINNEYMIEMFPLHSWYYLLTFPTSLYNRICILTIVSCVGLLAKIDVFQSFDFHDAVQLQFWQVFCRQPLHKWYIFMSSMWSSHLVEVLSRWRNLEPLMHGMQRNRSGTFYVVNLMHLSFTRCLDSRKPILRLLYSHHYLTFFIPML